MQNKNTFWKKKKAKKKLVRPDWSLENTEYTFKLYFFNYANS